MKTSNKSILKFANELKNAIADQKIKTILIRGYDDNLKLEATLAVLNDIKNIQKGTIFRSTSIGTIIDTFNRLEIVDNRHLNEIDTFKIFNNLRVDFKAWYHYNDSYFFNNMDFAIFWPINSILSNYQYTSEFISIINESVAKKNIIITFNDNSINLKQIDPYIQKSITLDTDLSEEDKESLKNNWY
ncbi:hypothetical protein [Lactobacillus sp. PSON]|uniref:hypothetical protein n=1 Tax=Lactobacillus sp. PSON TaxID=3455454 RepID=UPI00404152D1